MKQQIFFVFFAIILLVNCSQNSIIKSSEFFSTDNLETQYFLINNSSDTVLYSKSGIKIFIQKNSFQDIKDDFVKIQFKEAIELEDIVLGGLLTITTDGKPLESNGMVFLNATTRDLKPLKLKVNKTIEITIPNTTYKEGLKLFNSRQAKNGVITWEKSIDLDIQEELDYLTGGEALFKSNCASCHNWKNLSKKSTGPSLGNIEEYRDWNWIVDFTRNSQAMIAAGDTTAICIFNEYNKSVMTSFPNLSDIEIRQLYDFIKNKSRIQKVPIDSSRFDLTCDLTIKENLNFQTKFTFEKKVVFVDSTIEVETRRLDFLNTFYLSELSWANIDRFYNDERAEPREFFVKVKGEYEHLEIYIIFHAEKMFLPSSWNDGNKYSFSGWELEKMTYFPIGTKATILAIGKDESKTYFKAKTITYGDKDIIKISLKPVDNNISDLIRVNF